ncbi:MAG: hypothetical protein JWQ39_2185 [Glaciihabitans sp.]|nr:hypothetical protein [Glaciihabitans sp.]
MTGTNSAARSFASGGGGIPWLFYVPTVLAGIWICDAVAPPEWISRHGAIAAWTDVALAVVLGAVWYFGLARVPNVVAVRNVRRQSSDGVIICGAALAKTGYIWVANTARADARNLAHLAAATVIVASRSGMQVWGGTGDNARPIVTLDWSGVASVTAPNVAGSSMIALDFKPTGSIQFSLISTKPFSSRRIRGSERQRYVGRLEDLRMHAGSTAAENAGVVGPS